jgi:acetate kinase
MRVLVLNAGSASLKFDVVAARADGASADDGRALLSGAVEHIGREATLTLFEGKTPRPTWRVDAADHAAAARAVIRWLGGDGPPAGARLADVEAVAHRVAHGADRFAGPAVVDRDVLAAVRSFGEFAPLHNEAAADVIKASHEAAAGRPVVAVFDTSFFLELPPRAQAYAIPPELGRRHGVRRYGFHGISHRYLAGRYARLTGAPLWSAKLITLHLEGGCSAAAIDGGRPVDTSMELKPLEGLVTGTRSDDLEVFCYRIQKYVGAYLAALGGADAIVFGGGVGEDDPRVRAHVCAGFAWCGLALDPARNEATVNVAARISAEDSHPHVYVIPTREALQIAYEAAAFLRPS